MLCLAQFEQFKTRKYAASASPTGSFASSLNTSGNTSVSGGTPGMPGRDLHRTPVQIGSRLVALSPEAAGFLPQRIDVSSYTPNTALQIQSRQIEQLTRHIAELKSAELDLAANELEDERRRTSEVMKNHLHDINEARPCPARPCPARQPPALSLDRLPA